MNELIIKPWGESQLIFADETHHINRIFIENGGYCSLHCHANKFNLFFIEEGKLELTVYTLKEERKIIIGDELDLRQYCVYPNIRHRFYALEETIAYEIYFSRINTEDIIRIKPFHLGGIKLPESKSGI